MRICAGLSMRSCTRNIEFIAVGFNGGHAANNRYVWTGVDEPRWSAVFHAAGPSHGTPEGLDARIAAYISGGYCEFLESCVTVRHPIMLVAYITNINV